MSDEEERREHLVDLRMIILGQLMLLGLGLAVGPEHRAYLKGQHALLASSLITVVAFVLLKGDLIGMLASVRRELGRVGVYGLVNSRDALLLTIPVVAVATLAFAWDPETVFHGGGRVTTVFIVNAVIVGKAGLEALRKRR